MDWILHAFNVITPFSVAWFFLVALYFIFTSYFIESSYLSQIKVNEENSSSLEGNWVILLLSSVFLILISDYRPVIAYISPWIGLKTLLFAIPIYILTGVAWGVFKWRIFLAKIQIKYSSLKESFIQNFSEDAFKNDKNKFISYLQKFIASKHFVAKIKDNGNQTWILQPNANLNKVMITNWMMFWPHSMFFTYLHMMTIGMWENLYWTFNKIRANISVFLNSLSERAFKRINEEINENED